MSKRNLPRVVTIIYPYNPAGSWVYELRGEGPKNLRVAAIQDNGDIYPEHLIEREDGHLIILEGDHRTLVKRLRIMVQEVNTAQEQHGRDRERAIWDFRSKWDAEHPTPGYTTQEIIAAYQQAQNTLMDGEAKAEAGMECQA